METKKLRNDVSKVVGTPIFDDAFKHFDEGDDTMGAHKVGQFLIELGFEAPPKVVDIALDEMDPDATGVVSKERILAWLEGYSFEMEPASRSSSGISQCSTLSTKQSRPMTKPRKENPMLAIRMKVKTAEKDIELLRNRLLHLQNEEEKTQKSIEGARKRADEVIDLKDKKRLHQELKAEWKKELEEDIKCLSQQNAIRKAEHRERKSQMQSELYLLKSAIVEQTRNEKQHHSAIIANERERDREEKSLISIQTREKERAAKIKREEEQIIYLNSLDEKAKERMQKQLEKMAVAEEIIKKMEEEESEMIERVRISKEMQRSAFDHLEAMMDD